jgi:hypothetical protein
MIAHCPPQAGPRLDTLPFGKYEPRILRRLSDPSVSIIQARGCYWGKCTYCDYVELYDGSPPYRTRTPQRFVEEMEAQIKEHGVRRFSIITESLPPSFARQMSELILARGLSVTWNSFAMVERHFTAELFQQMVRSGCEYLTIGLETMNDRVLKLVEKAANQAENTAFLQNARAAGMKLGINLIPDLPSTTYDEAQAALTAIRGLQDCLYAVGVFPFEATRSSAIGRDPGRFGLTVINESKRFGQAQYATNHLPIEDRAMSASDRAEILRAYNDFANEINAQPDPDAPNEVVEIKLTDQVTVKVADERHDFFQVNGHTECYNWRTRRLFEVPTEWLSAIRQSQPVRKSDFVERFDHPAQGEFVFNQLWSRELLVAVN